MQLPNKAQKEILRLRQEIADLRAERVGKPVWRQAAIDSAIRAKILRQSQIIQEANRNAIR